jgi:hypothetical protein
LSVSPSGYQEPERPEIPVSAFLLANLFCGLDSLSYSGAAGVPVGLSAHAGSNSGLFTPFSRRCLFGILNNQKRAGEILEVVPLFLVQQGKPTTQEYSLFQIQITHLYNVTSFQKNV